MKLTIERAALLKALGHVQSAVERRNTIPILSNVLLSAERDKLTFSATDLDMEIIDEAIAQVDQASPETWAAYNAVAPAIGFATVGSVLFLLFRTLALDLIVPVGHEEAHRRVHAAERPE